MMKRCGYCGTLGHSARACRARKLSRGIASCGLCGQPHATRFCRYLSRCDRRRLGVVIDYLNSENSLLRTALKVEQEANLGLGTRLALIDAGELLAEEVESLASENREDDPWRAEVAHRRPQEPPGQPDSQDRSDRSDRLGGAPSADAHLEAIDDLLGEASERLADIQRRSPRGAQPLVVYLTEILDHFDDGVEDLEDALSAGTTPQHLLGELERRPADVRDTLLTMRHIPGVSREHLVRVARFADVVEQVVVRIRALVEGQDPRPD